MSHTQPTFDRVRARAASPKVTPVDVQGKSALFSGEPIDPSLGSVVITCSECHVATLVSYARAVKLSVPSVHLPLRRKYPTWMRCPACNEKHWVKVRIH